MRTTSLDLPIRRATLLLSVAAAICACGQPASDSTSQTDAAQAPAAEEPVEYEPLFVHTAPSFRYADGTLTLESVSDMTLYFSDRPQRVAGWIPTAELLEDWDVGENSFEVNPPNADLSIYENGEFHEVVVVLTNPVLADGDLTYTVEILEGELLESGGATTLFIDPGPVHRKVRRTSRRTARRVDRRQDRRD